MTNNTLPRQAVGIGLRRPLIEAAQQRRLVCDFLELAPENWMTQPRKLELLDQIAANYPLRCHGLSLSIGGPEPLDKTFLLEIKTFLQRYQIPWYSEHLSFSSFQGHLYDLMPMPFTADAASYVAERVRQVQDIIERPLVLENISYYTPLARDIREIDFILQVLTESACELLLDVNNVYVNSFNHGYDAREFIRAIPSHAIRYYHIAGHSEESAELLVDTHASAIKQEVYELLAYSYRHHGQRPTLLERDSNVPSLTALTGELETIKQLQYEAASVYA
ncbi:hypothetical protein CWI84_10535 [Idiomarina tyrosinivorans]|uniref:Uncharacterized protein n=1 Tax=Idiomarina tyrosinivorans TaxID=1445662 RepID=A0A432ZLC3_9GAMM|nr:DUF692 domain-containing protein [Idiomarina tyrosinivorans]RUO78768.1 hypothetical protein CWI84_10535 [Idiomarina tyrosinivorans]